jgi:hypothetical protein
MASLPLSVIEVSLVVLERAARSTEDATLPPAKGQGWRIVYETVRQPFQVPAQGFAFLAS